MRSRAERAALVQRARELYEAGATLKTAGAAVGLSESDLCYAFKRAGIARRPPGNKTGRMLVKLTEAQRADVLRWWHEEERGPAVIAARLDVCIETCWKLLTELGIDYAAAKRRQVPRSVRTVKVVARHKVERAPRAVLVPPTPPAPKPAPMPPPAPPEPEFERCARCGLLTPCEPCIPPVEFYAGHRRHVEAP